MNSGHQLTIFHSLGFLEECRRTPGRKVWLPDIPENLTYIEQLISAHSGRGATCRIEDRFPDLSAQFPEEDIQIFPSPAQESMEEVSVGFYTQSDTLSASVATMFEALDPSQNFILTPRSDKEGAARYLLEHELPHQSYSFGRLKKIRPDVMVLLNDWTREAQRIMAHCHWLGIPVVCVQESVIDFGDRFRRMKHADYAFVQGSITFHELERDLLFITGNPRYETLRKKYAGPPFGNSQGMNDHNPEHQAPGRITERTPQVLINCNFTYDIHEDIRYSWMDAVTGQVEGLGMDYRVSQHPRDQGDLSRYVNAREIRTGGVHEMLSQSSVFVTRFSSLIHEALIMGVPVIYFNPHRESMRYDFEFNDRFIRQAQHESELKTALEEMTEIDRYDAGLQDYLTRHCLPRSENPSTIIALLLRQHRFLKCRFSMKDFIRSIIFLPMIRTVYGFIKPLWKLKNK